MKTYLVFFGIFINAFLCAQNFTKIVAGPLVNTNGDSRSVNWIDISNDGYLDCMITNGPFPGQNNMAYINTGWWSFTSVSGDPLVEDGKPSDGATWADTDNDGDLDCFVANWYGVNNLFYTNNGNGSFTEIVSGDLVNDGGYSETASWGDFDNDGLVDLYVANSDGTKKNFMYHNLGGNTFLKITTGIQVQDAFKSRCVNWTDIDLDGDVDLFVTNEDSQKENIYRNDGGGNFTKLTTGPLLNNAGNTMSGSWGDFDNDGDLDVFLANDLSNNALFRNDGNFNFTLMSSDTVSKTPGNSFSSSWSDVDNDGDLDLFVTNAFKAGTKLVNYFYLNNGNSSFTRINNTLTADSSWSYGCAFGDYNNDGFEDLAVATCKFAGADKPDFLYLNTGNANKWITIKLTGTFSNKAAIGAKVKLKATINGVSVWQMREVSAQSAYCSQNDLRLHFGLGNATSVDSIKVEWPSGIVQHSINVIPEQFISITESGTLTSTPKHENEIAQVKIFPNPSLGLISLENDKGFNVGDRIVVSNLEGKKLVEIEMSFTTKQYNIDFKKYNIAAGNYLITLFTTTVKITQKVVIEN